MITYLFDDVFCDFGYFFKQSKKEYSKFMYEISFGFLPRSFPQGSTIYREDEDVEELYLIRKGTVSVGFTLKGQKYPAKELGPKNYFGAYYIFINKKSEFYFSAKTEVEAIGITKNYFLEVLGKHKKNAEEMRKKVEKYYTEEIQPDVVEIRNQVLEKYNMVNLYENIRIVNKVKEPPLETSRNMTQTTAEDNVEAEEVIEQKLDVISEHLSESSEMIVEFANKYTKAFEKLSNVLDNPAEVGLKVE